MVSPLTGSRRPSAWTARITKRCYLEQGMAETAELLQLCLGRKCDARRWVLAPRAFRTVNRHLLYLTTAVRHEQGQTEPALAEHIESSFDFGPDCMRRAGRLDELGRSGAQPGSVNDCVHAAAPDQHQFEAAVLVQAGPHAGRPAEVQCKHVVITLVKASEAGLCPNHDAMLPTHRTDSRKQIAIGTPTNGVVVWTHKQPPDDVSIVRLLAGM